MPKATELSRLAPPLPHALTQDRQRDASDLQAAVDSTQARE